MVHYFGFDVLRRKTRGLYETTSMSSEPVFIRKVDDDGEDLAEVIAVEAYQGDVQALPAIASDILRHNLPLLTQLVRFGMDIRVHRRGEDIVLIPPSDPREHELWPVFSALNAMFIKKYGAGDVAPGSAIASVLNDVLQAVRSFGADLSDWKQADSERIKLLVENAELKGRLSVMTERKKPGRKPKAAAEDASTSA